MSRSAQQLKVLSIVGPGRSGSTLLARVLGELRGVVDVGELRWIWRRGLQEGRPCGCGKALTGCPVWAPVLRKALGELPLRPGRMSGPENAADREVAEIAQAQSRISRRSKRIRGIRSASCPASGDWADLDRVRTATAALVTRVAETLGAGVIVDASKRPIDAAVLAAATDADHYCVHLVRDPRAVAFSWGRTKALAGPASDPTEMARRGALGSAGRWLENNLGTELLRRQVPADRWLMMRYEDFVTTPAAQIERVTSLMGLDGSVSIDDENAVRLGTHHTVAGNPIRFQTGRVQITPDDEWRMAMKPSRKAVVTAVTLPLLPRYDYAVLEGPSRG